MEPPIDRWAGAEELSRAQRAGIVLGAARMQVQRGWLQHGWHAVESGGRRLLARSGLQIDRTAVTASCLLGAVFLAASDYSDRPEDAAPAVDAIWLELHGHRGAGPFGSIDRVCAPAVRVLRMHDLVRWNDRPGRTRAEVLDLMDQALFRVTTARA